MTRFSSGPRIREARIAAGLTVEEVALAVGRTAYSIHGYEGGRIVPPIYVLVTIAQLFGCSIDDLLLDEQVPA